MAEVKGGDKFRAALAQLHRELGRDATLKVGFLSGATYPNGTPVAMVAVIQEFGAPRVGIPPRPFFRNMVAKEEAGWPLALATDLVRTKRDVRKTLDRMGALIAGQLRQSIVDTNEPPNSPVTNLLKQRFPQGGQTFDDVLQARRDVAAGATAPAGKPLVQSGHMLASVDFEVETK